MAAMFNPNRQMTEEERKVFEAMLKESTSAQARDDLTGQLAMSQALGKSAIDYEPLGGGSALGGAAGAIAKGMQGYMGGKGMAEDKAMREELLKATRGSIGTWYGAQMGGLKKPEDEDEYTRMYQNYPEY